MIKPKTENRKPKTIPRHVAFIMDGNRRWAKQHRLSLITGHRKAAFETIEPLIDYAIKVGISYLTFWAFSTENWRRDQEEVNGLLHLFREALADNIEKLHVKGARMKYSGEISKFPADIYNQIIEGVEKAKSNSNITINFALNYGGRDEILRAIEKLRASSKLSDVSIGVRPQASDKAQSSKLNKEEFEKYLDTAGLPDPDLIIRTGGEKRLSGFLLWQSEYSELYFTDVLFPDFTPEEFTKALTDYHERQRRFGT